MISVKNILQHKSNSTFVVELLADGKPKKFRLYVEPIEVDSKTIERIVCEEGLAQLLHARPQAAHSVYHGPPGNHGPAALP